MTRFADNIYSGFQATTSGASSLSPVGLRKTHKFTAVGGTAAITQTGTMPPNTENLSGYLFVVQNGSATVSNKITVSAGGTNLFVVDQFGSAGGQAGGSLAGFCRFTYVGSACAQVPAPATGQTNGGEVPYAITFLPASADKTGIYQIHLTYNRQDLTFSSSQGPYGGAGVP